jgi:hypothetical protein
MTTINLSASEISGLACVKVNGRVVEFSPAISSVRKISAGHWEGETRNGYSFEIFGGRAAGGRSNDWWVDYSALRLPHPIRVKSAVEAVKIIENS